MQNLCRNPVANWGYLTVIFLLLKENTMECDDLKDDIMEYWHQLHFLQLTASTEENHRLHAESLRSLMTQLEAAQVTNL